MTAVPSEQTPSPTASEAAFLDRLQEALALEVSGVCKGEVLRSAADAIERAGEPVQCRIVPFVPGRRPSAEAAHPGLGSSKEVAVILRDKDPEPAWVLYALSVRPTTCPFTRACHSPVPTGRWLRCPYRAGRIGRRHR